MFVVSVLKDLRHSYDPKFNIVTFELGTQANPQTVFLQSYILLVLRYLHLQITLSLEYTGEINDKMRGFYRSSYKDEQNQEKFLASTQFEVCSQSFLHSYHAIEPPTYYARRKKKTFLSVYLRSLCVPMFRRTYL